MDINALFRNTVALMKHDLKLDNIRVKEVFDSESTIVAADEDQLAQIFLNFLNNSKDAMKGQKRGTITFQTKKEGDRVEIRFADTGHGIPNNILGKIFDPFFTTKPQGQGTGLGLSITHNLIEGMEGALKVNSEEGKGTEFIISLPVAKDAENE